MDQLPVFFNLKDKWVAVVGGGIAAARKVETALEAGAQVKVVAEQLCQEFDELRSDARLHLADGRAVLDEAISRLRRVWG